MSENPLSAAGTVDPNQQEALQELIQFISIPSISAGSEHQGQVGQAAEWLVNKLGRMGAKDARVFQTDRYPIVCGEFEPVRAGAPVLLLYGHYDVMPVEPLAEWSSGPFEPVIAGDYLFGRGASDMKGQIMACLAAVGTLQRSGGLPVRIKCLFEGEEEIGSPSLGKFLRQGRDRLQADLCLVPDSVMLAKEIPTITYGLRGLANFELSIWSSQDFHSGIYGGVVCNPANEAARLLAGLQGPDGKITLPHFYDDVVALDPAERAALGALPVDEDYYKRATGLEQLWGEPGYTPIERSGARPTFDITGFSAGHTGPGFKTIIPSRATVKISFRLVPNQAPENIRACLEEHIARNIFPGLGWKLDLIDGSRASIVDTRSAGVRALAEAMQATWGVRPAFYRMGGTVPVVGLVNQALGVDAIITGFGLPDDHFHAPNERLHLPTWGKGIRALARFFENLGRAG